jgi:predicted amidohydrolase YtcJ
MRPFPCFIAASIWAILGVTLPAQTPDLILHHGKVVTVDADFSIAEAVAIEGDRIVSVGPNADVRKLAGPATRQIDLQGKTVIPGLMDSHTHATGAAMYEFDHTVPDMETIADVLAYIRARADVLEDGEWIRVRQVFITRLRAQRYPTRAELDETAPNNPVYFSTGPDASLNSLALKLSRIDKDYRITDGKPGLIERNPDTGEPTGIVRSGEGFIAYKPSEKTPTIEDKLDRLKHLLADYNSIGITTIADRNASEEAIELYRRLRDQDVLSYRVFINMAVDAQAPLDQIEAKIRVAASDPLHAHSDILWLRGVKVFLDGGMLTGSAYMREPWGVSKIYSIEDPQYQGMRYIEPGKLYRIARLALKNDFQMTAHSVGDGAVHALIEAYEEVNSELPVREQRPCITHSNFMSLEAIQEMKALGLVADL